MIKTIKNFFKRILSRITPDPLKEYKEQIKECNGAIVFKLNKDKMVDISCLIPEIDENWSVNKITKVSEDYAELLVLINDGVLSTKIIDFIKDIMDKTENEQEKLFLENVLVFWGLLHVEYLNKKKTKSNQPVIRPSAVFRP